MRVVGSEGHKTVRFGILVDQYNGNPAWFCPDISVVVFFIVDHEIRNLPGQGSNLFRENDFVSSGINGFPVNAPWILLRIKMYMK